MCVLFYSCCSGILKQPVKALSYWKRKQGIWMDNLGSNGGLEPTTLRMHC